MSLSANDQGTYSRPSSGKTPPPAPSAAFAKRARELQSEQSLAVSQSTSTAHYRPPAMRAMAQGASPAGETPPSITVSRDNEPAPPPTNYPSTFRRARAGTLPSNVSLAAQRFASTLDSTPVSPVYEADSLSQVGSPVNTTPPSRPNLRHATSVATSQVNAHNRLRSGSLTLPTASNSLASPFGSSLFSSSWLTNPSRGSNVPTLEELRSHSNFDSGPGIDDFDVHTLDYLGLDDFGRPPPPVTVSELRNQAQAAIAGSLANPSRVRANTVSNPYRNRAPGSLLPPSHSDEQDMNDHFDLQHQPPLDYETSLSQGTGLFPQSLLNKGFKQASHLAPARPRAVSVANLDDAARNAPIRRSTAGIEVGYTGEAVPSPTTIPPSMNMMSPSHPTQPPKLQMSRNPTTPTIRFPNNERQGSIFSPGGNSAIGRESSPKTENAGQIQTPSRSLWIGNLDSTMTSETLIHVFAPYGAIESLRLLPEKECGFVNFVDQADAIRAKEDVLNRLGGNIGMQNGQTVRIGFGKADSAPVAPTKNLMSPGGIASPASALPRASPIPGLNSPGGGMDAQLQSTPTRALWIGSIPSTTTPATILSVFSPFGPIESARVLTHKNCGFINFERLDDAVRARKALNGRDVLGSDVGAVRIGFAKVPVRGSLDNSSSTEEPVAINAQGVGDLSVGATIHALRSVKGASTIPADQQVLGGAVENYRSNLLLSMIAQGTHNSIQSSADSISKQGWTAFITEQQMIMKEIAKGAIDAEADIQALAEFRPPSMYYTTIPAVSDKQQNRKWDAARLRELRKRLDSGSMSSEEVDEIARDLLDGELVELASDWLGNTVVQKLFEKASEEPRFIMLERIAPHLASIGIHKNGTWAAQKIIDCISTAEEIALVAQHLRPYTPPLLLDQFGNYVVQCCLRFGYPANDFIFDAMIDRLWEVAQGRFGARSIRTCLESQLVTISQQRRLATAVILNSIPLATNPNGALLLTWLLDNSGFPGRYKLLAPRFTPHLSHLCTHKLASLTVLRIINQKVEPEASKEIVQSLFNSPNDHVLTDVLGDQVNGVAVIHKVLTSVFIDPADKPSFLEATKRVLIELKVIATQAYRRLIEEVGLPIPSFQPQYSTNIPQPKQKATNTGVLSPTSPYNLSLATGFNTADPPSLASMMAALQLQSPSGVMSPVVSQNGPPQLQINPNYQTGNRMRSAAPSSGAFSPTSDPFNPFALRSPEFTGGPLPGTRNTPRRSAVSPSLSAMPFSAQSPSLAQAGATLDTLLLNANMGSSSSKVNGGLSKTLDKLVKSGTRSVPSKLNRLEVPLVKESVDRHIEADGKDPQFMANLRQLGQVSAHAETPMTRRTIRETEGRVMSMYKIQKISEQQATLPQPIPNCLSAVSLANLLDDRKFMHSKAEVEKLAGRYSIDYSLLKNLVRFINTPSIGEGTVIQAKNPDSGEARMTMKAVWAEPVLKNECA
ncbi:hypothetical protein Clacol_006421 [Clathrus columnatus]|uniref:Uncharacterized protein n=1 Tax=Clathrus columnatus TaxID=1419009 RepID=A0AAV5ACT3_9AGAM|nr:hypothetical protein Clacol_006421 [Clathrus columnatus]